MNNDHSDPKDPRNPANMMCIRGIDPITRRRLAGLARMENVPIGQMISILVTNYLDKSLTPRRKTAFLSVIG